MSLRSAILAAAAAASASATQQDKPHVFFVLVDDFGWADAGWHRNASDLYDTVTPAMNKLVKDGLELNRHYVFMECTPTRASLQSGRLPSHLLTQLCGPCDRSGAIPYNMTGIAQVMKKGGYATHQVGKWDAGMVTPKHTPKGRGYDTSLTYFGHGNWMWSHGEWEGSGHDLSTTHFPDMTSFIKDFWDTDKPATQFVDTGYEEYIFRDRMQKILTEHNKSTPLFLNYDARVGHYPIQAPYEYQQKFSHIDNKYRMMNHAMVNFLDDQLLNVTTSMQNMGYWDNTLMVLSSDNGGYVLAPNGGCGYSPYQAGSLSDLNQGYACYNGEAGANNYPLRGGKYSDFEGGIRVNAFVSGGWSGIDSRRGQKEEGMMHVADWYGTLANLIGVDPTDEEAAAAGLPPIDSVNMLDLITGKTSVSPRTEYFVREGLLVTTKWKYIAGGKHVQSNARGGPAYPNMTNDPISSHHLVCPPQGCLFDLETDLFEEHDVSAQNPDVVRQLKQQLEANEQNKYYIMMGQVDHSGDPACKPFAKAHYGGYYGPWKDLDGQ